MAKAILITGGARSGKSRFAERLTLSMAGSAAGSMAGNAIYIATAEALDAEMAERIATHQARRGPEWETVNAPLSLLEALHETDHGQPRLVDCLTLWLSNLMHHGRDWEAEVRTLAKALPDLAAPVVFVTNEVGGGIVPENRLARAFRDAAGLANQEIAAACDELWLVVAGHPMKVKPNEH